jgi:hypothetical protein
LNKIWRLKNGQNGCNTLRIQFFATTTYKYQVFGAGLSKSNSGLAKVGSMSQVTAGLSESSRSDGMSQVTTGAELIVMVQYYYSIVPEINKEQKKKIQR